MQAENPAEAIDWLNLSLAGFDWAVPGGLHIFPTVLFCSLFDLFLAAEGEGDMCLRNVRHSEY
jgi:hypothetical protein